MPVQAANPFGAFIEGRKARQDKEYGRTRNALAQMELEQAPAEMAQRNKLADLQIRGMEQQFSQDQITQALTQTAAAASRLAQSSNPKAEAQVYKDFMAKLREQNPEIDQYDDEQFKQYMGWIAGEAQAKLGIAPASASEESFTLKPGEARFRGDKVIAERGAPPEKEPAPSFQHVTLENGNIGAFDSRTGRITDTGQKAPPSASGENRTFTRADKLRDEYNAASKEFVVVGDSYTRVTEAARDPSAAGDLSMIFAYMKMLDPNSVVREQEFANAQNAAGVPDRVRAAWNKLLKGERLAPAQRTDFLHQAEKLYEGQKKRHDTTVKKRYTEMSKRWNIDPADVVGDLDVGLPSAPRQSPASAQPASPGEVRVRSIQEAMALPPGTVFITPDGRRKVR